MGKPRHFGRELWDGMGNFVQEDDGLVTYPIGSWTKKKLFFLSQYLAQTTQAMHGNPNFSGLTYIDLFAGAGVCVEKEGGKRYPGSALLAAGCFKPFDRILLVEENSEKLRACETRVKRANPSVLVKSWNSDANQIIDSVIREIPARSLSVAFIDPFSLDIHFETIRAMAGRRAMDLIILFADRMDMERNAEKYYFDNLGSKLDLFLGPESNWREKMKDLHSYHRGNMRRLFASIYLEQLSKIGYTHSRIQPITSELGPLYSLVYASKHKTGLKFWDIAISETYGGDKTLFSIS